MQWREVPDTNGLYLVSDTGEVFSVRNRRLLKKSNRRSGYYYVELNINGLAKKENVHRLVALAFIPNPDNLPVVNHKDENPKNNNAENLEWCTYKYNTNYGTCIARGRANREYHYGEDNAKSKTCYQFTTDGKLVAVYGSAYEAARTLNLNGKSISKARSGRLKTYAGYVWRDCETFEYEPKMNRPPQGTVLAYKDGKFVKRYATASESKADGFDPNAVRDVCRGMLKIHHGHTFKYESEIGK